VCIIYYTLLKGGHTLSKKDKLLESMKNNPKNINFEQLKKVLEDHGYMGMNTGGSHWVLRKDGCEAITIPYKRPVKIIYVKKVLEILGVNND
jgi:predicted RNA binding protein YcfA (HicA-like mRNA interferase family)